MTKAFIEDALRFWERDAKRQAKRVKRGANLHHLRFAEEQVAKYRALLDEKTAENGMDHR